MTPKVETYPQHSNAELFFPLAATDKFKEKFVFLRITSATEEELSSQQPIPEIIERTVATLFDLARDEEFEYGIISKFSSALSDLIHKYGFAAIEVIQDQINNESKNADTVIEALHTLAKIEHFSSHAKRLLILSHSLFANSTHIRCGAALGLAYMDDPRALPFLRQALEQEPSKSTRTYLQRVIEQIVNTEQTQNAKAFSRFAEKE